MTVEFDDSELLEFVRRVEGVHGRVTEAIKAVIDDAGQKVADRAKDLAPRGKGKLRRSIRATPVDTRSFGAVYTVEVGPTIFYGRFQEDGTAKMSPRSFLGPALAQHEAAIEEALADAIEEVL